ncbi:ATP synthase F1 subunit delta [Vulcanibacillus modesticaldus]|uniref:ATP synthase subunit delta n=2 Tax=Vulcanibacillus modesticaldus TaxID=337097 RepID=A0A1D2YW69_9BACI|nr:ATP synthase F1 subunit delta [Vulcanibacillus modesticaldus]
MEGLVAKRYAKALFEVAKDKGLLDQVEQDLQLIVKISRETEDFMTFLRNPQISGNVKKDIIDSAFKNNISEIAQNLFYQLIDRNRVEVLEEILYHYVKLANEVRGIVDVVAITATPLDDATTEKIAKSFSDKMGKKVRLKNSVDPTILGGMVIRIGDRIYDGSINTKLQVIKRSLTASRV